MIFGILIGADKLSPRVKSTCLHEKADESWLLVCTNNQLFWSDALKIDAA